MSAIEFSPDLTQYPLLPLRDVVVFPHMVIPLFVGRDRKSTRLNSSHITISYAVFCLNKKKRGGLGAKRGPAGPGLGGSATPGRMDQANGNPQRLFFLNDAETTEIYTLSLHDALPI